MTSFSEMIDRLCNIGYFQPKPGYASIAFWKDAEHFKIWAEMKVGPDSKVDDVRTATLPLSFLTMIKIPEGHSCHEIALIGVGFSKEDNYSDSRLMDYRLLGFQ